MSTFRSGPNQTIPAGQSVTLTGTYVDPDANDTHSYAWTATDASGQVVADGTNPTFTFTPPSAGIYTSRTSCPTRMAGREPPRCRSRQAPRRLPSRRRRPSRAPSKAQSTTIDLGQLIVRGTGPVHRVGAVGRRRSRRASVCRRPVR